MKKDKRKEKNRRGRFSEKVLSQYFTLEGNRAVVDLYFECFEELIDPNVGNDRVEMLNHTLWDKMDEIFALIPGRYEISIRLHIRNFGTYGLDEVENIIRENIALKIYALALDSRRKHITGLSLLGSGCAMLLFSYFLGHLDWPQIVFDVINISGTLFVWEAADISLIERNAEAKRARQYVKKFKEIDIVKE